MNLFKCNIFLLSMIITLASISCARNSTNQAQIEKKLNFLLPKYEASSDEKPIELWATYYYLPQFIDGSGDVPLRDLEGNLLGPMISLKEWCSSALEGSVRIKFKNGDVVTYNYSGTSDIHQNDCSSFFKFNLGRTKFKVASSVFGEGVSDYRLIPYRTIATDPKVIPTGSLLYIPEARGAVINLENGDTLVHDGYFFAADVGGAIKENHIDVFIGIHEKATFFPWIGNRSSATFKAYLVSDSNLINEIHLQHLSRE